MITMYLLTILVLADEQQFLILLSYKCLYAWLISFKLWNDSQRRWGAEEYKISFIYCLLCEAWPMKCKWVLTFERRTSKNNSEAAESLYTNFNEKNKNKSYTSLQKLKNTHNALNYMLLQKELIYTYI